VAHIQMMCLAHAFVIAPYPLLDPLGLAALNTGIPFVHSL